MSYYTGTGVCITILATKKAFDTVWHTGLLIKFYKLLCNKVIWQILEHYLKGLLVGSLLLLLVSGSLLVKVYFSGHHFL